MYAIVRAALPEKNILLFCLLFFRSTYGCSLALVSISIVFSEKKCIEASYTVCRYAYINMCAHIYTHILCMYIYIYIYICVCIYIYTNTAYISDFPSCISSRSQLFSCKFHKKIFFSNPCLCLLGFVCVCVMISSPDTRTVR